MNFKMKYLFYSIFALLLLASCSKTKEMVKTEEVKPMVKDVAKKVEGKVKNSGIDLSLMDKSVRPQDDFFRHVNGAWLDKTEIPADRSRWGSFDELRKKSSNDVLAVLEEAIASGKYQAGTDQYKAASFYQSGMDTEAIDAMGAKPILPYLDKISMIKTMADIQKYNEETAAFGERCFFGMAIFPDLKNSTINAPYLATGALGLPERDYYLKDDDDSSEIRNKYVAHITRMLGFIGYDEAMAMPKAKKILAMETALAEKMMAKEDRRNPLNLYNPMPVSELSKMVTSINWDGYFNSIGVGSLDTIIVLDVKAMEALDATIKSYSIEDCKDLMMWNELNGAAGFLSSDIEKANFDFYSTELSGVKEMRPRWEKVLNLASGIIGEAICKLYVDKHFPPAAKTTAVKMVGNVKTAFAERIKNLDWMTDATKIKALDKLASFTVKIGYPDKWKDYSTMDIKAPSEGGTFIDNMLAASNWFFQDQISKLGKEVDKSEWGMSPQTVNAYYNPLNNEIVFPAAILQPPFFDHTADAAVNYGGIGAVIGHEISHGFDDQGSRFDASGNMTNWWTDEDRESFDARNQTLIDQFNAYEPLPGVFVNGEFTLGENIGDLGGINAAYDGLQLHLAEAGSPGLIDEYTPEQRFFFSWATIWRGKLRDEEMKNRIKTDPHSPGMYRAAGPLSNLPAFYEAFDLKETDKMYRPEDKRVKIW